MERIKKAKMVLLICFVSTIGWTQSQIDLIGNWQNEERSDMVTEFYLAKDGLVYGKRKESKKDLKNEEHIFIKKLKYSSDTKTFMGTMTPPDKDILLNVVISFENKDRIKMVARKLLMSKTIYFKRIKQYAL